MTGLEKRLAVVRDIQDRFPEIYLGGSLALYLQGIYLDRDYEESDVDLNATERPLGLDIQVYRKSTHERVPPEQDHGYDRDFEFEVQVPDAEFKIELAVHPKFVKADPVVYKGYIYRVTNKFYILEAKCRYAAKGNKKNIDDIIHLLYK
jgi:hypothetical protein